MNRADLTERGYRKVNLGATPFTICVPCGTYRHFDYYATFRGAPVTVCTTCHQAPAPEAKEILAAEARQPVRVITRDARTEAHRADQYRIQRELK